MQLTKIEIELGVREENGDGEFRQAHGFNQLVTRRVCTECNSGWMSQLEVDFLSAVGHLIEPEWPKLKNEFIREALIRNNVIAKWAIKTAITANLAGIIKRPIPSEITSKVQTGNLPPQFSVKLAHIRRRDFNMITHRGFWFIDKDEKRWRGAESGRSFDVLFQLNHLAIRAINAPGVELGFDAPDGILPIAAFPCPNHSRQTGYSFDSLDDFERRLVARIPLVKPK